MILGLGRIWEVPIAECSRGTGCWPTYRNEANGTPSLVGLGYVRVTTFVQFCVVGSSGGGERNTQVEIAHWLLHRPACGLKGSYQRPERPRSV